MVDVEHHPVVLITDYAWPSLDIEQEILGRVGATLLVAARGDEAELVNLAPQADAILTCWQKVTPNVLDAARTCRIVARYGIGLEISPSITPRRLAYQSPTSRISAWTKCLTMLWPSSFPAPAELSRLRLKPDQGRGIPARPSNSGAFGEKRWASLVTAPSLARLSPKPAHSDSIS